MVVFPARAGMSPRNFVANVPRRRVPRASGDEPEGKSNISEPMGCSPRERG